MLGYVLEMGARQGAFLARPYSRKTSHILGSREGDMYRGPLIAVTAVLNKRRRGNVASDQGKEFSKQTAQGCISIKLSPTEQYLLLLFDVNAF